MSQQSAIYIYIYEGCIRNILYRYIYLYKEYLSLSISLYPGIYMVLICRMVNWVVISRMVKWVVLSRMIKWVVFSRMVQWALTSRMVQWVVISRMVK